MHPTNTCHLPTLYGHLRTTCTCKAHAHTTDGQDGIWPQEISNCRVKHVEQSRWRWRTLSYVAFRMDLPSPAFVHKPKSKESTPSESASLTWITRGTTGFRISQRCQDAHY
eukprot:scaffold88449_cov30-Tisochrysis_lutea.AAC.9